MGLKKRHKPDPLSEDRALRLVRGNGVLIYHDLKKQPPEADKAFEEETVAELKALGVTDSQLNRLKFL